MGRNAAPMVLVASADQPWRSSCAQQCLASGCDVHTASSGFRAIDDLRKHEYDLIVFDNSMPDVSAFELHLNIRDVVRNAPAEIIAASGDDGARIRITNGSGVHIGTHAEALDRLTPILARARGQQSS